MTQPKPAPCRDKHIRDKLVAPSPTAIIKVAGIEVSCVLDTGAETSLIPSSFYYQFLADKIDKPSNVGRLINLVGANDLVISVLGYIETTVTVYNQTINASFLVKQDTRETQPEGRRVAHPVILGC